MTEPTAVGSWENPAQTVEVKIVIWEDKDGNPSHLDVTPQGLYIVDMITGKRGWVTAERTDSTTSED